MLTQSGGIGPWRCRAAATGLLVAVLAMSGSTVLVAVNALLLKHTRLTGVSIACVLHRCGASTMVETYTVEDEAWN